LGSWLQQFSGGEQQQWFDWNPCNNVGFSAVFLWFYAQKHADELGIKKKKKVSNKKLQRERARYTQVGGD